MKSKIEKIFPDDLSILIQNKTNSIILTKEQVCCVLIHMFFCTINVLLKKIIIKIYIK